jgi:hypothetical protein
MMAPKPKRVKKEPISIDQDTISTFIQESVVGMEGNVDMEMATPVEERIVEDSSHITPYRFDSMDISTNTKRALSEKFKYEYMTAVQHQSMPAILKGHDVFVKVLNMNNMYCIYKYDNIISHYVIYCCLLLNNIEYLGPYWNRQNNRFPGTCHR